MIKVLEEVANLEIAIGQSSGTVSFQPKSGLVIGCAIYTAGGENAGFVNAKITDDSGEIISPASDIRNYRDREAGYREGKKPLYFETKNKTYVFTVQATENFTSKLKAQLVLVYENDYTTANKSC